MYYTNNLRYQYYMFFFYILTTLCVNITYHTDNVNLLSILRIQLLLHIVCTHGNH